jgi:VWFA-related protein
MRRAAAAAGPALAVLIAGASAGEAAQAPPDTRFPAEVEQVTVDAVVLDKRGEPVDGLTREDFTVLEEGRPQPIVSFDVVRPSTPPGAGGGPRPGRDRVATNVVPVQERGRLFVVVFDDLHLSPTNARRAKAAVASFLEKGTQEGDRVLLVASGGGAWWSTRLPDGRADLLAVLKHLDGRRVLDNAAERMTDYEAVRIAVYRDVQVAARVAVRFEQYGGASRQAMNQSQQQAATSGQGYGLLDGYVATRASETYMKMRARMDVTLGLLERCFRGLQDSRDRKAVLLVSEGFPPDPSNPAVRRVLDGARRAGAVLYFVDTRGLLGLSSAFSAEFGGALPETDLMSAIADVSREGDGSAALAADTGGFAVRDTNDFAAGAVRIGRESRRYYLLGYTPAPAPDGRFRKIEVRVRRKGLMVRARKGYYPAAGVPAPPAAAADAPRDRELQRLLDSPGPVDALPLRLAAHALEPAGLEEARVLLAAEADVSKLAFADGTGTAALDTLLVLAHRETGDFQRADVKVELQRRAAAAPGAPVWYTFLRPFNLKAGGYQAKLVVRDGASGRSGSVILEFDVPPLDQLRVSTPILTDMLQRDDGGGLSPVLTLRRAFSSGGQLFCRFDVYGAARGPDGHPRVAAGHTLRRADGSVLDHAPERAIQPTSIGALLRLIQIPLAGAPPGEYELVLSVRDEVTGQARELVEPFSVTATATAAR